MKHLNDVLMATRIVLGIAIAIAVFSKIWMVALILYCLALLTDIVDSEIGRKYPYESAEKNLYVWRVHPEITVQVVGGIFTTLVVGSLAITTTYGLWLAIIVVAGTILFHGLISFFGHIKMPKVAELVDVIYGWMYSVTLFVALVIITGYATKAWLILTFVYAVLAIPVIFIKKVSATSRPDKNYGK